MDHALVVLALVLGVPEGVDWDTLAPVLTWDTLDWVASPPQVAPTLPAVVPSPPAARPPAKPVEASAPPSSPCGPGGCRVPHRGLLRGW